MVKFLAPSMIMELIKEADDLKKRRSSILSLTDEEVNFGQFNVTNLKTSEVPGWREQLLHLGKKSLKLEEDKMATKYCQDLKSFEEYINSNYLINVDVLDDLFSQIKRKSFPGKRVFKTFNRSLLSFKQSIKES